MKQIGGQCSGARETFADVSLSLLCNPYDMVIRRWNWKSAFFSSLSRGLIFLFVNLTAGWSAASGASLAELSYRASTSGFAGALTQAFRSAEPRWAAAVGLPIVSHLFEFLIHWLRGTPNLVGSITASLVFTFFSTLFNLHAMRRGVLTVGRGSKSLLGDLKSLPMTMFTFLRTGMGFKQWS